MSFPYRAALLRLLVAVGVLAAVAIGVLTHSSPSRAASLGQLNSQLGAEQARQQHLSSSVSSLSGQIAALDGQISLVESREAAVRQELAQDRAALARAHAALVKEQARLAVLRARLARARMILSRQVLSSYEGDHPDLVSVVLDARGFTDLLEQINFLGRAEHQQQTIITITREAKHEADLAAARLARLQANDRQLAAGAEVRVHALAGMNALLQSKQALVARDRAAQQASLNASRARSSALRSQISRIEAQQRAAAAAAARAAAAAAAAAATATPSSSATPTASGPALGPGGGWAIPYPIVLCESGGQNLSPNSAGASGYYQIMPATWKLFGGSGPAAYLASKAEQDAVASRIWNGGAGASNWVCAGIVGIH